MRKLLLFGLAMMALPGRAQAMEPLFASEPLDDEELGAARGGFILPGGIEIGFGANIVTSRGGDMLLKTTMNLTDNGPEYSIQKPDGTVVAIQGGTLGTDGSVTVGPANAGSNLTVSVELADLFVEHTMGNRISSLVANTADNQVISNQVTVNLQLNNVNPLALGSAGFQIEALSVDAASFRVP